MLRHISSEVLLLLLCFQRNHFQYVLQLIIGCVLLPLVNRGDPHYVGLMGIDIFDKGGHLVTLSNTDQQIWANPADINVLPEYGNLAFMMRILYTH